MGPGEESRLPRHRPALSRAHLFCDGPYSAASDADERVRPGIGRIGAIEGRDRNRWNVPPLARRVFDTFGDYDMVSRDYPFASLLVKSRSMSSTGRQPAG